MSYSHPPNNTFHPTRPPFLSHPYKPLHPPTDISQILLLCCLLLLIALAYIIYLILKSAPLISMISSSEQDINLHRRIERDDQADEEEAKDPYDESRAWDPSPSLTPVSQLGSSASVASWDEDREDDIEDDDNAEADKVEDQRARGEIDELGLERYFKAGGVGIQRYCLDEESETESDGREDQAGNLGLGRESGVRRRGTREREEMEDRQGLKGRVEDWVDGWVDRGVDWGMKVLGERE